MFRARWTLFLLLLTACGKVPEVPGRSSILLVTLDTTRADAIGPDTPSFNALAKQGLVYRYAYATTPQTLPSHASMLTGLYPAGHGVHENARFLASDQPLVSDRLHRAGYRTAAFVSAFVLARRFGLARGFDTYDDDFGQGRSERIANETTDRAIAYLGRPSTQPVFLWVHYYDPHHPYTPPEPFRSRYKKQPYLGEVASMDEQLGRLVNAFYKQVTGPKAIIVVGDHGESLGDHGEAQHGNLLYQPAMHVPLIIVGSGVGPETRDTPVSARRVFHTILDWAGLEADHSLRRNDTEVVLGEAMIPFLQFGWQPQAMAIEGRQKVIFAGQPEVYDVIADPAETQDLAAKANLSREIRKAIREYPIPSLDVAAPSNISAEERRQLASLGYIASEAKPVVRKDAPRPRDMVHLFDDLDKASTLFVQEEYAQAIPILERIVAQDPHNLMAALRVAAAHSALGHNQAALKWFKKAEAIAPSSPDVRAYLALHYVRMRDWERAAPLLERVVAESPDRLPALEALADIRERQGRLDEALRVREKINSLRMPTGPDLIRTGELAMGAGNTAVGIDAFEKARALQGSGFKNDLELGVLYVSARRYEDAKASLDRVPPSHPAYPMALFKRAQVSVLLGEPDRAARIDRARKRADATTRELIVRERLFR